MLFKALANIIHEYMGKKIVFFGTGSYSECLLELLPFKVMYFVDNDSKKWNTTFKNLPVLNPTFLLEENKDNLLVVIASTFDEQISTQLREMGFSEGIHYWNSVKFEKELIPRKSFKYAYDGLYTQLDCDFMDDSFFQECFRIGPGDLSPNSGKPSEHYWRTYVYLWAGKKQLSSDGDFVECGVCKGGYARALINYTNFENSNKMFYLFDTYEGLLDSHITADEKLLESTGQWSKIAYEPTYEQVIETFKPFQNVVIVKGPVPETLTDFPEQSKVAFLSIDMNCVIPEIAAAEFFWDKLVSGGIIVLDDYGWPGHVLQRRAFDKFANERAVEVLHLPTGQGLIFKP